MNSINQVSQVLIAIIPIVGIVMGSVLVLLYLIFSHKQKMLMLEKGISKKLSVDLLAVSLFAGFSMTGVGLGLTIFFALKDGISYGILSGLVPLFLGIGIISFFIVWKKAFQQK